MPYRIVQDPSGPLSTSRIRLLRTLLLRRLDAQVPEAGRLAIMDILAALPDVPSPGLLRGLLPEVEEYQHGAPALCVGDPFEPEWPGGE